MTTYLQLDSDLHQQKYLNFFCPFDKNMKKELIKGKNIKVDKIGKFILI